MTDRIREIAEAERLAWKAVQLGKEDAAPLSRGERAHYRLTWAERLARNARPLTAGPVTIRLFGIPEGFAISLGLATA